MLLKDVIRELEVTDTYPAAVAYLKQLQDIFDEMEVVQEFEDAVWIKVSKSTLFGELK